MKKLLVSLVAAVCLTLSACNVNVSVRPAQSQQSKYAQFAHHIKFNALDDGDSCSSVAVGSHTLLTAAHCVMGTGKLDIDGNEADITATYYDEQDHVLITENGVTFSQYTPIDQRVPVPNEHVQMWGWPGRANNAVFREGNFEKTEDGDFDNSLILYAYLLPVYSGDSGSGVISDEGKVITVVSLGDREAQMFAFKLAFTPQQLAQIK